APLPLPVSLQATRARPIIGIASPRHNRQSEIAARSMDITRAQHGNAASLIDGQARGPQDEADHHHHDPEQRIDQHADEIAILLAGDSEPVRGNFARGDEEEQHLVEQLAHYLSPALPRRPGLSPPETTGSSAAASWE